jgi:hypothetical protein
MNKDVLEERLKKSDEASQNLRKVYEGKILAEGYGIYTGSGARWSKSVPEKVEKFVLNVAVWTMNSEKDPISEGTFAKIKNMLPKIYEGYEVEVKYVGLLSQR